MTIYSQEIGSTCRFPSQNKKVNTDEFYNKERAYFIPPGLIRFGKENTITIRVYDRGGRSGIYKCYIGIAIRSEFLNFQKQNDDD